jgi:pSer/pThr/pTyr-binding forkhead associated (FHA) protein
MIEPALELFRKACGLNVSFALEWEEVGRSAAASAPRVFEHPFVLVGREPKADLFLDNPLISQRHAFLQAITGRILVIDLQSRSKVYWEGEASPRSRGWLDPHRYIQVGPYRIRLASSSASDSQHESFAETLSPADAAPPESSSLPRAALELPFRAGDSASLWRVEGQVALVGRSEESQLVLADESISRIHAALVTTPLGVWVVDLVAREGVYVNGECVRWAWLADGDTVRLGRFTLTFRYETPPDQMSRERVPLEAGAALPAQTGTEVVARPLTSDSDRRALALHHGKQAPAPSLRAGSPGAIEPDEVVESPAGWEPAVPGSVNPLAMWQQQMQLMESFHNDMIMMVQMFVALHREHMASVRHELDMVQKLTGELALLQAKAAQSSGSANAPLTGDVGRSPKDRPALRVVDHTREADTRRSDRPDRTGLPTEPDSAEPSGDAKDAGPRRMAAKGPASPESIQASARETSEVHALLTERIAQLQRERQGYWQRILSTINK